MPVQQSVVAIAHEKLTEAIAALKEAQKDFGRGANEGGREASLAVTNAEQALLWLGQGTRVANAKHFETIEDTGMVLK